MAKGGGGGGGGVAGWRGRRAGGAGVGVWEGWGRSASWGLSLRGASRQRPLSSTLCPKTRNKKASRGLRSVLNPETSPKPKPKPKAKA